MAFFSTMFDKVVGLTNGHEDDSDDEQCADEGRGELFESKSFFDYDKGAEERIALIVSAKPNHIRVFLKSLDDESQYSIQVNEFITIEHIKQFIYSEKKRYRDETSLIFDGRQLEDEKRLTEYHIRSGDTLSFNSIASGKTIVCVLVENMAQEKLPVFVELSYTVDRLMALIYHKNGLPIDQQRLVYEGVQLEGSRQLGSYPGVNGGSTIHLLLCLRGGGYPTRDILSTPVMNPFRNHQSQLSDPIYRQFSDGVNSEGYCHTSTCDVHDKMFVCRHGYGVYRVYEHKTRCPVCQCESRTVESFGFSRANVAIRAMTDGVRSEQSEIIRSHLSEKNGNYSYLPYLDLNSSDGHKYYEFIEVFSSPPDCPVTLGEHKCSVCRRTLYGTRPCDHGLLDIASLTL